MTMSTYQQLKNYRSSQIKYVAENHFELNRFHDRLIKQVVYEATNQVSKEWGPSPSPFSFFIMGSGGRLEQSIWSDQDHGIIYKEDNKKAEEYFSILGHEISKGLSIVGYQKCDGGVMASNPLWCKPLAEWEDQIKSWEYDLSWESIRHLLIFIDARSIFGNPIYIYQLKKMIYQSENKRQLLSRMLINTMHIKKGLGVLGQFLVESHGLHSGSLNIKETAVFPYVHAFRLLAYKENIYETSTLSRLNQLSKNIMSTNDQQSYKAHFLKLLNYRLLYCDHSNYDNGHYLSIDLLSKTEKKDLKEIIKLGNQLHQYTRKLIEKGVFKC